mmetsp:Transcript_140929/g.245606  ORF Transcript_140929/g.245606 Transcript_140929/m.245606 type:complete len:91 (+) Transcript_140929:312-584(+)
MQLISDALTSVPSGPQTYLNPRADTSTPQPQSVGGGGQNGPGLVIGEEAGRMTWYKLAAMGQSAGGKGAWALPVSMVGSVIHTNPTVRDL